MKNANEFIEQLKTDEGLRNKLGQVAEGDWNGIKKVAEDAGFAISDVDLANVVPKGFFLGYGTNPDMGWPKPQFPLGNDPFDIKW